MSTWCIILALITRVRGKTGTGVSSGKIGAKTLTSICVTNIGIWTFVDIRTIISISRETSETLTSWETNHSITLTVDGTGSWFGANDTIGALRFDGTIGIEPVSVGWNEEGLVLCESVSTFNFGSTKHQVLKYCTGTAPNTGWCAPVQPGVMRICFVKKFRKV